MKRETIDKAITLVRQEGHLENQVRNLERTLTYFDGLNKNTESYVLRNDIIQVIRDTWDVFEPTICGYIKDALTKAAEDAKKKLTDTRNEIDNL